MVTGEEKGRGCDYLEVPRYRDIVVGRGVWVWWILGKGVYELMD